MEGEEKGRLLQQTQLELAVAVAVAAAVAVVIFVALQKGQSFTNGLRSRDCVLEGCVTDIHV